MRSWYAVVVVMIGLMGGSCGPKDRPPDRQRALDSDAAQAGRQRGAEASAAPLRPRDAQWTIQCQTISAPNHVQLARRLKDQLTQATPLRDWYVVHGETESTLYYGFYRSFNDPADARETSRAQADRRQISALTDTEGGRPFRHAIFVELEPPDPGGPPEWDLTNADGYWSVQIAAYEGSLERKQYAVDAVREARARGIEAYYYHGESMSSVNIGVWPREAVKAQQADAAATRDPSQPLLVLPGPLPQGAPEEIFTPDGRKVQMIAPRVEIQDRSLQAVLDQYPIHALNGVEMITRRTDPRTGKIVEVPDRSFLIQIPLLPRREQSVLSTAPPAAVQQAADADELSPPPPLPVDLPAPAPAGPGVGRLRSIGD